MSDTNTETNTQNESTESTNNERGPVPYSRFTEVYNEKKRLDERVAAMEAELAPYKELDSKYKELEARHTAAQSEWQSERALLRAGLSDPEAMDVAKLLFSRIPEADRPEGGIESWLSEIKKDPSKGPKALQPFFAAQTSFSTQQKPNLSPKTNGYDVGSEGNITAEMLRAAKEEAIKTRDWTKHKQLVAQLQKSK